VFGRGDVYRKPTTGQNVTGRSPPKELLVLVDLIASCRMLINGSSGTFRECHSYRQLKSG